MELEVCKRSNGNSNGASRKWQNVRTARVAGPRHFFSLPLQLLGSTEIAPIQSWPACNASILSTFLFNEFKPFNF